MGKFRFEDLIIWQESIKITSNLFDFADRAEQKKQFRFAEQLRGAGLSISNNICEGSGSTSKKDFANYLNISRRSLYECVNILYTYKFRNLITESEFNEFYNALHLLSIKINNFRNSLQEVKVT
ncbi:MAG: four helix bundle protein [Bacteroidetes bacterium B1(2017)]|nr:MAG: four helix bundle protein [Bacteroidetes bacterium B1(2017)]